jgi:hypothetical protein
MIPKCVNQQAKDNLMKITREMTREGYLYSKQVYEGAIDKDEALDHLEKKCGMNRNSAADYINNFKCMVEGKKYTRTSNGYATDHFLKRILADYGVEIIKKALSALEQHIEYYEKIRNTNMNELRAIHKKFTTELKSYDQENQKVKLDQKTAVVKPEPSPIAQDIQEPSQPDRLRQDTYRILRDTLLAREVKEINQYKCQLCGQSIQLKDGRLYAEAHHVKPLGSPHNGPDVRDNILCVCPNHHVLLDYGAISLDGAKLSGIGKIYIDYHNKYISK